MGNKKKRDHPDIEEVLGRPWCYYCERDFDDLKILINHQKAKHFKCERCGRRLNTAGGLSVHMTQVHKETLASIDNALPNRSNLEVEIFGMEGIPEDVVNSHNQRVLTQFAQVEADRRAATGNSGPGGGSAGGVKKPKFESPSDLKKRLAEHKAKKAAEQAAGIDSGDVTPVGAGQGSQSPSTFAGSPSYPQQQMPYGGPPGGATYSSFPQSYVHQGSPYQQQPVPYTQQSPGFAPPGAPQYPPNQAFAPPQQYSPPSGQAYPPQYQNGPPRPYGAGSPPMPMHQQGQFQPPRTQTPPQGNSMPQRPGTLPPAPGLPQRPSFGAPPVNAFQMQQMHQGQIPGPSNPFMNPHPNQHGQQPSRDSNTYNNNHHQAHPQAQGIGEAPITSQSQLQPELSESKLVSANASSLDDLVSTAANDAGKAASANENQLESKPEENLNDKKGKKEKEKNVKLVYSDNETSPEEKMARLPRYAFVPDERGESVLGDATTAAVTGVVSGPDDVMDNQG